MDVEDILSRIIKPETAGKDRNRLVKAVAIALRELVKQPDITVETRDIAAFIALALEEIHETIDASVVAWEKRGYWVKADRFRLDWAWTGQNGTKLRHAITEDDWAGVALIVSEIAKRLSGVKIPMQNRSVIPWTGAYRKITNSS